MDERAEATAPKNLRHFCKELLPFPPLPSLPSGAAERREAVEELEEGGD